MEDGLKESHLFNTENGNISEILSNQDPNEMISEKIVDLFSIRLSQLEQSYKEKDAEISDLMFKLHSIILLASEIKVQLPQPVKLFGKRNNSQNEQEDLLNSSKMSTMSRRSVSSSKGSMGRQFGKITEPKDKMAKFSQKAAINICASQSQDTNMNRSILNRSPKKENIPNNQTNLAKVTPGQNKFNVKAKTLKPGDIVVKGGTIKTSDDKLVKVNIITTAANNIKSPILHANTKSNKETINVDKKPFNRKTNSDDLTNTNNKGSIINQNSKNVQTSQVMKTHIGNYHSSGGGTSSELFINQVNNKVAAYKLEPKKKNNLNLDKITKEKFQKLFLNKKNQNILKLLFKFSIVKEQFILKNISKETRKMYFLCRINELSTKFTPINNNPDISLEMEIPKILDIKINKESLILSNYTENYQSNSSFINIVNLLYILVNGNEEIDWGLNISEKIKFIEEFTKPYDVNKNFYKALKEITEKLKSNHNIYDSLKKSSNLIKFIFGGLTSEFTPLIEYLFILNKAITNKSNTMELLIDLEINNHKIDILKTLSDNF